jgi:hypothetical protein
MKQIVSLWRLTLRKILTALMAVVPFSFGACDWWSVEYGPGPEPYVPSPYEQINGTVTYKRSPVRGFFVSVLGYDGTDAYTLTDRDGKFSLKVYSSDPPYTLFFQDVDGPLNGEFNSKTVQWTSGDGPLNIVLVPKE